jgi:uncharacterized protein (DUF2236 family)
MSTVAFPVEAIRRSVRGRVEQALAARPRRGIPDLAAFAGPPGDPGLFGPASATWRVHADLPSMLVGGVSALLLQTLHPLAMAGVVEHSAYRTDPLGRLQRTAAFVGTATFGSTPAAMRAIATVRAVHRRVHGRAPDGRWYDATDPDLLTWVHTAEAWSFLRAYRRFGPRPMGPADADRYLREMAVVAVHLGAADVPTSVAETRAYFRRIRPELTAGAQALSAAAFIVNVGGQSLPVVPVPEQAAQAVLVQAAIDLLPAWAAAMLQLRRPLLPERVAMRASADTALMALRWAVGPSPAMLAARARCTVVPVGPVAGTAGPPADAGAVVA